MHCNGHCYLTKQLKKAEEREKHSTQSFKEKDEIISGQNQVMRVAYFPAYNTTSFIEYNRFLPVADNYNSLIKPPAA